GDHDDGGGVRGRVWGRAGAGVGGCAGDGWGDAVSAGGGDGVCAAVVADGAWGAAGDGEDRAWAGADVAGAVLWKRCELGGGGSVRGALLFLAGVGVVDCERGTDGGEGSGAGRGACGGG